MKPGMKRIIFHWTAGSGRASALDREHYHRLVEFDGTVINGKEAIEDNIVTSDDDYAAHTLRMNTGSIGVAVCGMMDAKESPFEAGPAPITEEAFDALAQLGADLCMTYGIPVSDTTTLTHAEVEPNLGVKQRGKWDITRLPFKPELRGAKPCGDYLRKLIRDKMQGQGRMLMADVRGVNDRPVLRKGDQGAMVFDLQAQLKMIGRPPGLIDGRFGDYTHKAVVGLQAAAGITMDGVVGPETWEALRTAEPPPERDVTADDLRQRGSTTVKAADAQSAAAVVGIGGISIEAARSALDVAAEGRGALEWAASFARDNWPLLIVLGALAVAWVLAGRIRAERVRKAVIGADVTL